MELGEVKKVRWDINKGNVPKLGAILKNSNGEKFKVLDSKDNEMTLIRLRIYRQWSGNPSGIIEDMTRCITNVSDTGRGLLSHQCMKPRGYGKNCLYCKKHKDRGGE